MHLTLNPVVTWWVLWNIAWLVPQGCCLAAGDPLATWTPSKITGTSTNANWNDVVYENNTFVAVGKSMSVAGGAIATSSDGRTWEWQNSSSSYELFGITYGNGMFVAVGGFFSFDPSIGFVRGRTIISSANGREWASRFDARVSRLHCVAYGNGIFVAAGLETDAGTAATLNIVSSPDGITWTHRFSRVTTLYSTKADIVFAEGTFVVTGLNIHSSSDGIVWSPASTPECGEIVYGNGLFFAKSSKSYLISDDARTWNAVAFNSPFPQLSLGFGAGRFIRTGFSSVEWSSDGRSWTVHRFNPSLISVAFGAGRFVGVAPANELWHSAMVSRFQIEALEVSPSGIRIPFDMPIGAQVELAVSTNLTDWTPLKVITNRTEALEFTDQRNSEMQQKFYRAKLISE